MSIDLGLAHMCYIQSMTLYVGLISELVALHTDESGDYPYTKEQFCASVNLIIQTDSPTLNRIISSSLSIETESFEFLERNSLL